MSWPDAATQVCGVVGHPVAHSLSPHVHNAALRHDGRNAVYLAFDVPGERFGVFVDGMAAAGARGLNVTIPHKLAALAAAGRVSKEAARIGAANVLVFGPGEGVTAHNTDAAGVAAALEDLDASPAGARVLVLGAGGAARAAGFALAGAGAAEVTVCNRTPARAEELAGAIRGWGAAARTADWAGVADEVRAAEIVVNATSTGLDGSPAAVGAAALERAALAGCRAVLDLVYGLEPTDLVASARAAGIAADDGLGMLVHQAAETYRLLWGAEAPLEVMRDAAAQAAGRRPHPGAEALPLT